MRSFCLLALLFELILTQDAPVSNLGCTSSSENPNQNANPIRDHYTAVLGGIDIALEPYRTWGQGIEVNDLLLTAYPKSEEETARVVNWARQAGRKVRARGYKHSFAPLTVTETAKLSQVVLIDLHKHLTKMEMVTIPPEQTVHNEALKAVKVQTGASWEDLLTFCEQNNAGIVHSIIIGDATVGGVLAVGSHGAAIPAVGEEHKPGFSFGSLSNLIVGFTALVWDSESDSYVAKSFLRSDPESGAFLAHLGRALLLDVTLLVGENYNLRCKSILDIPAEELFADPATNQNARTFTSFLDSTGRADVQWYQFTKNPWLKVWSIEKEKPSESREVHRPYNYPFPVNVNDESKTVPELGEIAYNNIVKGLAATNSADIWGPSKNILLYSNGASQPIVFGGFVVLTNREKLQTVLSQIVKFYKDLNDEYAKLSEYPIDYYIKFRVTGIDNANETLLKNAAQTLLSPVSPSPDYPNFNVALWMNTYTNLTNVLGNQFMERFEFFYFNTFKGENGLALPEWPKAWAYTQKGPFTSETMLHVVIPRRFKEWDTAMKTLDKYDPERLFSNPFLNSLFGEERKY